MIYHDIDNNFKIIDVIEIMANIHKPPYVIMIQRIHLKKSSTSFSSATFTVISCTCRSFYGIKLRDIY